MNICLFLDSGFQSCLWPRTNTSRFHVLFIVAHFFSRTHLRNSVDIRVLRRSDTLRPLNDALNSHNFLAIRPIGPIGPTSGAPRPLFPKRAAMIHWRRPQGATSIRRSWWTVFNQSFAREVVHCNNKQPNCLHSLDELVFSLCLRVPVVTRCSWSDPRALLQSIVQLRSGLPQGPVLLQPSCAPWA